MAVKIVRQAKKIALLGVPTSAAAMSAGHEGAPAALRKAGFRERLESVGYEVNDFGDDPVQLYKPDEESPRARNLPGVVRALEALKPRVEQAVKSCALPVVLSGDCSVALAVVAGARRYFRRVSLLYMDRDADLNTPATTPSGCVDGMVVSHLIGRGAAELVRFWGEPPLVREPDLALFGVDRLDPSEEEVLRQSALRFFNASEIKRMGASAATRLALERIHGRASEFVLHLDVDVIADFPATNYPGSGGLTLAEVREALDTVAQERNLAAIEITAYNPARDPDGTAASTILDLVAGSLEKRLEMLSAVPSPEASEVSAPPDIERSAKPAAPPVEIETKEQEPLPETRAGEAWSSDSLRETAAEDGSGPELVKEEFSAASPAADADEPAPPNESPADEEQETPKSPDSSDQAKV